MRMKNLLSMMTMVVVAMGLTQGAVAKDRETGRGTGPVVYVESQGLFYDSKRPPQSQMLATFQELKPGVGPSGLATEFGPGDVGYLGGRWWIDANENGAMDDGDAFFLCPLLGPGRNAL